MHRVTQTHMLCCAVLCLLWLQGGHTSWLLHVVQHVADHSGMYVIMQAVEEMLGPHHIARLERLTYAALTRCVHTTQRAVPSVQHHVHTTQRGVSTSGTHTAPQYVKRRGTVRSLKREGFGLN